MNVFSSKTDASHSVSYKANIPVNPLAEVTNSLIGTNRLIQTNGVPVYEENTPSKYNHMSEFINYYGSTYRHLPHFAPLIVSPVCHFLETITENDLNELCLNILDGDFFSKRYTNIERHSSLRLFLLNVFKTVLCATKYTSR